jgi:hypothetical protein
LILPEYLVEFDYLADPAHADCEGAFNFSDKNLALAELGSLRPVLGRVLHQFDSQISRIASVDDDPLIPHRSEQSEITIPLIQELGRTSELMNITYLNLTQNRIARIENLDGLICLR